MIVYPDGVWYRCPNKKVLREIIEEHIQHDRPLEQYILQQMPAPVGV
jgi:(2Fe-2S) ferredoxin